VAVSSDDILKRVPPQNLEAEQSVLGAILLDNDAINHALEILTPDDFYRETHREIFRAMVALTDHNQPVDAITLTDALRTKGALEAVGGPAYIAELASIVPTAANVAHYARITREKAVLRSLASIATDIASNAYEAPSDVDSFLDDAEHRIFEISERRIKPSFHTMPELTRESLKILERLYENREMITGVPSGFVDLDRITAGFQPSDLVVIAARPSMGKTALALNMAEHISIDEHGPGKAVLLVSLEMSALELGDRLLCSRARVNSHRLRNGQLNAEESRRLIQTAADVSRAPLFIDDSPSRNITEIAATARRLKRQDSLSLIVVDYLQLIEPDNPRDPRQEQVARISRRLKGLARELSVPILCLAQLNRQVEATRESRPQLSHLRESGAIEQDADVVAFVHREEFYQNNEEDRERLMTRSVQPVMTTTDAKGLLQ